MVAIGSCFAGELRKYLRLVGLESKRIWVPEGLNNTYALLDFSPGRTGRRRGPASATTGPRREDPRVAAGTSRRAYSERLREAGAVVFTIGVAEVWQDKETGGVFWHGVPEESTKRTGMSTG